MAEHRFGRELGPEDTGHPGDLRRPRILGPDRRGTKPVLGYRLRDRVRLAVQRQGRAFAPVRALHGPQNVLVPLLGTQATSGSSSGGQILWKLLGSWYGSVIPTCAKKNNQGSGYVAH